MSDLGDMTEKRKQIEKKRALILKQELQIKLGRFEIRELELKEELESLGLNIKDVEARLAELK